MTKRDGMTKAQRDLLQEAQYGCYSVKAYRPAQVLVERGLARWDDGDDYGGALEITPAGRAALANAEKQS